MRRADLGTLILSMALAPLLILLSLLASTVVGCRSYPGLYPLMSQLIVIFFLLCFLIRLDSVHLTAIGVEHLHIFLAPDSLLRVLEYVSTCESKPSDMLTHTVSHHLA